MTPAKAYQHLICGSAWVSTLGSLAQGAFVSMGCLVLGAVLGDSVPRKRVVKSTYTMTLVP